MGGRTRSGRRVRPIGWNRLVAERALDPAGPALVVVVEVGDRAELAACSIALASTDSLTVGFPSGSVQWTVSEESARLGPANAAGAVAKTNAQTAAESTTFLMTEPPFVC
jgi:hypothetical protein